MSHCYQPMTHDVRLTPADISSLYFNSLTGSAPVSASDIGAVKPMERSFPLMLKDLQTVVMVNGAVTGDSPLYSALDRTKRSRALCGPVQALWSNKNPEAGGYAVRRDGERAFQRDI